jgi:hypothetical protein
VDQLRDFLLVTAITVDVTLDPLQPDSVPGFGELMAPTPLSRPTRRNFLSFHDEKDMEGLRGAKVHHVFLASPPWEDSNSGACNQGMAS